MGENADSKTRAYLLHAGEIESNWHIQISFRFLNVNTMDGSAIYIVSTPTISSKPHTVIHMPSFQRG